MQAQAGRVLDIEPIETFEGKLWALSRAAVAINSERSVEQMLRVITEQARAIIGAHLGSTSLTLEGAGPRERWPQHNVAVSMSSRYGRFASYDRPSQGADWYGLVCQDNQVVRLTEEQLREHPLWRDFGEEGGAHPPLRGWLAAPLVASDGRNIGLLQLSDAYAGEFVEADEAILVQLAQLASIAVEKAQLQQQLVTRERQQLTQDLLAGLSHDMQTPLAVILGLATILRSEPTPTGDEVRDLAEMLELQGGRLRALIRQFLDYVRLEAGEPLVLRRGAVELRPLLAELTELFGGQRELDVRVDDALAPVRADHDRVLQILTNLVGNAIKFSDDPVVITVQRDGDEVAIAVADSGRGIAAEELERVFDKLYRGDGARVDDVTGHGLGLYISRALATALDGRLEAASDPEQGSTFTLTLPVHDGTAAGRPASSR